MARGQGRNCGARATAAARTSAPPPLGLQPLTAKLIPLLQSWFDEAALAHLGDESLIELAFEEPQRIPLVAYEQGEPVGLLIVELLGELGLLSVLVAPEARGRGIATRMLRAAVQAPEFAAVDLFVGGVDADNHASRYACINAGFCFDGYLLPGDESELRFVWQRPRP